MRKTPVHFLRHRVVKPTRSDPQQPVLDVEVIAAAEVLRTRRIRNALQVLGGLSRDELLEVLSLTRWRKVIAHWGRVELPR